eukprot:1312510-Amorphochlora_amoeboformis.AAC.1
MHILRDIPMTSRRVISRKGDSEPRKFGFRSKECHLARSTGGLILEMLLAILALIPHVWNPSAPVKSALFRSPASCPPSRGRPSTVGRLQATLRRPSYYFFSSASRPGGLMVRAEEDGLVEQLSKLKGLLDAGALTSEEYATAKARVLAVGDSEDGLSKETSGNADDNVEDSEQTAK